MLDVYTRIFANQCSEVRLDIKDSQGEEAGLAGFAGIALKPTSMSIRLPTKKVQKARGIVLTALEENSLTLLDLQLISGCLNLPPLLYLQEAPLSGDFILWSERSPPDMLTNGGGSLAQPGKTWFGGQRSLLIILRGLLRREQSSQFHRGRMQPVPED